MPPLAKVRRDNPILTVPFDQRERFGVDRSRFLIANCFIFLNALNGGETFEI